MSTPWLAPEMRVMILDGDKDSGVNLGDLAGLVQSVRVEQVANEVSKATVTLANVRTDGPYGRQQPPWRFDKLDYLEPGTQIRIDARYVGGASYEVETANLDMPAAGAWYPLIRARVTDLRFTFPQSGASMLTLQAEDLLSMFRARPAKEVKYVPPKSYEADIVKDVLDRAKVDGLSSVGAPKVTDTPFGSPRKQKEHPLNTTYLAFLQELAKEIDYEVFVDFDRASSAPRAPLSSAVSLHFERARSMKRETVIDLVVGLNLLSFQPAIAFWEPVMTVKGKGRDPNNHRAFEVPKSQSTLESAVDADLGTESAAVIPAYAVRKQFEEKGPKEVPGKPQEITGLDPERAERRVQAMMLEAARKFLTAEVEALGLPSLRPGIHVKIDGFKAPFDGHYYVTKAVHSLDGSGYKTTLSVRRPGYTDPSGYPFSAVPATTGGEA